MAASRGDCLENLAPEERPLVIGISLSAPSSGIRPSGIVPALAAWFCIAHCWLVITQLAK